jgi:putative ABC transport system permease protein
MWNLFKLSIRNVFRNRGRSGLTMGAIGFGVFFTMLIGSFIEGLGNVMIDDIVLGKTGALQVHRKGYDDVRENQPLDLDFDDKGKEVKLVQTAPGVRAVSGRIIFGGLLNNGSQSTMFQGTAYDPKQEFVALPWAKFGLAGKAVGDDPQRPNGAVLGEQLSAAMQLAPGTVATLQAATREGRQNALDLDILGVQNNGNAFEAQRLVNVPLVFAQDLLGMKGRVTELAVALKDREQIEEVAADLRSRLGPEWEVQTWMQLRPNVADVVRFQKQILMVIAVVFLVIAVIGVVNTMLMAVLERTREIGTMMAVGVRRGRITYLFLLEGLALAAIGGTAGIALAGGIVWVIAGRGGLASTAPGSTAVYHIIPAMPLSLVLPTFLAATLGTLAAAAWPAWRAARLNPVDALRAL